MDDPQMGGWRMAARRAAFALPVLLVVFLFGCGPKTIVVEVPPRIDLQPYGAIGVVDFTSDRPDNLNQFATQKFMSLVQASQPNVRFLELGPMDQLLRAVGRDRMDREALQIVGARYNVATIFTGAYEISDVRPQIRVGEDLSSVSAAATVRISLTLRHFETKTGVTLWTNSRQGQWPVARVGTGTGGGISVSVSDPQERYAGFMEQLINAVAYDFRHHYERRVVPEK
ncbi:MAG: hypothetical protein HYY54_03660 [candidate division NC10 bacterium]|nr:hypothetical protein [candidate division NC10 bacterium]